jgi:hypothetical protein
MSWQISPNKIEACRIRAKSHSHFIAARTGFIYFPKYRNGLDGVAAQA